MASKVFPITNYCNRNSSTVNCSKMSTPIFHRMQFLTRVSRPYRQRLQQPDAVLSTNTHVLTNQWSRLQCTQERLN